MPRQGPRRPLLNLRVSEEEQDRLRERAEAETEGNVSELGRRMIRFASLTMPKDWTPMDWIYVPDENSEADYDPGDGRPSFKATRVCIAPDVARRFNGNLNENHYYEGMWRTEDGRWVFELRPMDMHKPDLYEFLSDRQAREWLEANRHDEAVREFFGA